jgi:hypothetical protein
MEPGKVVKSNMNRIGNGGGKANSHFRHNRVLGEKKKPRTSEARSKNPLSLAQHKQHYWLAPFQCSKLQKRLCCTRSQAAKHSVRGHCIPVCLDPKYASQFVPRRNQRIDIGAAVDDWRGREVQHLTNGRLNSAGSGNASLT